MNSRLRRTIGLLTAVSLLGLVGCVLSLAPAAPAGATVAAHAAAADPALSTLYGGYHIYHHDTCLGTQGGKNDAPVVQWNCLNHPDQFWHWGSGSTYKQLINGNGQCLGIAGGSNKYGAQIVGWTCNGHSDQYWISYLVNDGGTTWQIFVNQNPLSDGSWATLSIAGGSTAVGALAVTWTWSNTPDQLWHS